MYGVHLRLITRNEILKAIFFPDKIIVVNGQSGFITMCKCAESCLHRCPLGDNRQMKNPCCRKYIVRLIYTHMEMRVTRLTLSPILQLFLAPTFVYIIVRQRVRGSTQFRNPLNSVLTMLGHHSSNGRRVINRVDPIGLAV